MRSPLTFEKLSDTKFEFRMLVPKKSYDFENGQRSELDCKSGHIRFKAVDHQKDFFSNKRFSRLVCDPFLLKMIAFKKSVFKKRSLSWQWPININLLNFDEKSFM